MFILIHPEMVETQANVVSALIWLHNNIRMTETATVTLVERSIGHV